MYDHRLNELGGMCRSLADHHDSVTIQATSDAVFPPDMTAR